VLPPPPRPQPFFVDPPNYWRQVATSEMNAAVYWGARSSLPQLANKQQVMVMNWPVEIHQ
jgi:hypothetical protein